MTTEGVSCLQPANISLTSNGTTISVQWDAVSGATGYDLEADGKQIYSSTATSYLHTDLGLNTTHTYRVRAKNAAGSSSWTTGMKISTLSTALDCPANLMAVTTENSVAVTWEAVQGATAYELEADRAVVYKGTDTAYTHTLLEGGTQHTYRVRTLAGTFWQTSEKLLQKETAINTGGAQASLPQPVTGKSTMTSGWIHLL